MSAPEIQTGEPDVAEGEEAVETKRGGFITFLDSPRVVAAIEAMLPAGQALARVRREIINAVYENPKILGCYPESIIRAVSKAVSYNLVIGDTVFLIPRKKRKTDAKSTLFAQLGYKGVIELLMRHRVVRFVDAHPVYKKEHYLVHQGTAPSIEHHTIMDPDDRGPLVGGYAYARITQTEVKIVEISRKEVDAIKKKFSFEWKDTPLEEIAHWYVPKAAIMRLSAQLPMPAELAQVLHDEDDILDDEDAVMVGAGKQKAIGAGVPEFRAKPSTANRAGIVQMSPEDPYAVMQQAQVGE